VTEKVYAACKKLVPHILRSSLVEQMEEENWEGENWLPQIHVINFDP